MANAQIFDMLDSDLYRGRVKLVSEFMARFNGQELSPQVKASGEEGVKANLCQLFDIDYILKDRNTNEAKAFRLVDSIMKNDIRILFSDREWFAKVKCVGLFKGKEVEFALYLTVQPRGKDMYKWVIADAEGKIFDLAPSMRSDKIMLLPNEHESNFMKLNSISSEKDDYITLYSADTSTGNRLAVFNTLFYYDFLNIDYVSDIEFTFLQVPGYAFTIREFERESTNSGWLISDWKEMTEGEKEKILNRIYNGKYRQVKEDASQKTLNAPVKTDSRKATEMVEEFIGLLDSYIKNPEARPEIEKITKGRYTFTMSDEICNKLADFFKTKKQKSYRLDTLLGWLSKTGCPVESISVENPQLFENENIRPEYSNGYTLIKAELNTSGNLEISEQVVFFIYQDQIAGVKFISDCF